MIVLYSMEGKNKRTDDSTVQYEGKKQRISGNILYCTQGNHMRLHFTNYGNTTGMGMAYILYT